MKKILTLLLALSLLWSCGCAEQLPATSSAETTAPSSPDNPLIASDNFLSQEPDETVYQVQLTPEQAADFDSASMYIVYEVDGVGSLPVYKSNSLSLEGTVLTADFNGKLIYVRDDHFEVCYIPTTTELETRDGKTLYQVAVQLESNTPSEDGQDAAPLYRAYLVCDRATGEIEKCKLLPDGQELQGDPFRDEWPVPELSGYSNYFFPSHSYKRPSRNDEGILEPIAQWTDTGSVAGTFWAASAGMKFFCGRASSIRDQAFQNAPMYYFFQVQNKDGSGYCTEPQPLTLLSAEPPQPKPQELTVQWSSGNRALIFEESGLQLYLRKAPSWEMGSFTGLSGWSNIGYALELYNSNETSASVKVENIICNHKHLFGDEYYSLSAQPGKWASKTLPIPLGAVYGDLKEITSLSLTLLTSSWDDVQITTTNLTVEMLGNAAVKPVAAASGYCPITEPCLDALAESQVLWEEKGVKLSLIGFGMNAAQDGLLTVLCLENGSDESASLSLYGQSINSVYFDSTAPTIVLPPHSAKYVADTTDLALLEELGIASIGQTMLYIRLADSDAITSLPVTLSEAGSKSTSLPKGQLLLEEAGLRVTLLAVVDDYGSPKWTVLIENRTDRMLHLTSTDETTADENGNDTSGRIYFFGCDIAANSACTVSFDASVGVASCAFRLVAKDTCTGELLFETTEALRMPPLE